MTPVTWILSAASLLLAGTTVFFAGRGAAHQTADRATATTMEAQAEQITVLLNSKTLLEGENRELRDQLHELSGRVDQLSHENADLRGLVMGAKVPPAMQAALDAASQTTVQAIRALVEQLERKEPA